jgi:YegS/Rv2252/BmrU family lipid kinase
METLGKSSTKVACTVQAMPLVDQPMSLSAEVIINAAAGTSEKEAACQVIAETFAANGIAAHIALSTSSTELVELAQRAAHGEARIVVAGGGDGTLNAVASALVGTDKIFGVLPLGTLNHFAKDLQVPLELADAVRTICAGHTRRVDVGEVNGRIFLNNSSLGLYPSIVHEREAIQRQGYGKWSAFFRALLAVLREYPFLDVWLSAAGKEVASRTPFVLIGNNKYVLDGFKLGGRACLDAGELSLYTTGHVGRLGLLRLALRALFGRLRGDKDFLALCAKEVWIETRRRQVRVSTDGEVALLQTPLYYRIRPGALRVLVPADSQSTEKA